MERFCSQCDTRLARDNPDEICGACCKKTRDVLVRPPTVPAGFWESIPMRKALATRHMGKIERAFRTHAYARPISQSVAASWFFLTQAQLSRIESGPPIQNMDRLIQWAHILRIPANLLWFPLPDGSAPGAGPGPTEDSTAPPCPSCSSDTDPPSAADSVSPTDWSSTTDWSRTANSSSTTGSAITTGRTRTGDPSSSFAPPAAPPPAVPHDAAARAHPPHRPGPSSETSSSAPSVRSASIVPPPSSPLPHDDDDEWRRLTELSRTAFFERGIGAVTLPAIGLDELQHIAIALTDARRYADDSIADYFRRQLDGCAANDRRRGPKRSIPVMIGLIAAIEQLAREARTEIRHELLRIGSRAAELAGWFYRDIVMPELSNYWRDRAVEWAQATGDFCMQGYALLKKSQTAWDDRDRVHMLTLAQAVQEGPWRLPPHILAEAALQEARAYAMMSRPADEVEQRLDRAHALLARHRPGALDPGAGLSVHYDEALFNLQLAICRCEGGQSDRALALYDSWLTPDHFSPRDYGYFLSLKGLAYAVAEEPDEAASAGLRALALARETDSARTHREVLRLAGRLRLWRERGTVRELRGALLA
jgi:tetratricopeptide (TPR) repeat protein